MSENTILNKCSELIPRVQNIKFDEEQDNIDEDFYNALDVLRCFLSQKNHNIITELEVSFERKSNIVRVTHE